MFPRQDVGAKGSSPVQEPLRQPVFRGSEIGGLWEFFHSSSPFFGLYFIYGLGKHSHNWH